MKRTYLVIEFSDAEEEQREDLVGYLLSHDWDYQLLEEVEE